MAQLLIHLGYKRLGVVWLLGLLILVGSLAGCSGEPKMPEEPLQPPSFLKRDIRAVYRNGVLSSRLPEEIRVQAVVAAANMALLDRGYMVLERSATAGLGRVHAVAPEGSRGWFWPDAVTVTAAMTNDGQRIDVDFDPGDRVLSYAVLDDILRRLGR